MFKLHLQFEAFIRDKRMNRKRRRHTRRSRGYSRKNNLSRSRRKPKAKSPRQRKLNIVLGIVAVIVVVFAVFFVRNLYFYITGSDVTSENMYPVKGVDVSSYQLDIDWKGLEQEGFRFAFIKATEGSGHVDGRFEYNWKEANKTSMKVGAYHFLSYDTDGETQAQNFIDTVDKKWGMLPPAVDVEFYGEYVDNPPSRQQLTEVLDIVLDRLEDRYGRKPIIYTNSHIYEEYISGNYDDYPIWISAHDIPERLSDGRKWTFCQYTFYGESESVARGEKYVDMNVFNGSSWDFRGYDGK